MASQVPICKALLLCERTIVEAGTGKVSLIGVFNQFLVDDQRTTPAAEVFCEITDANGRYDLVMEVRDLVNNEAIARAVGPGIEIPNPLIYANVIIPIPSLKFPHLGTYDFVILANGEEIDRQTFSVINAVDGSGGDHGTAKRQNP